MQLIDVELQAGHPKFCLVVQFGNSSHNFRRVLYMPGGYFLIFFDRQYEGKGDESCFLHNPEYVFLLKLH